MFIFCSTGRVLKYLYDLVLFLKRGFLYELLHYFKTHPDKSSLHDPAGHKAAETSAVIKVNYIQTSLSIHL